MDPRLVQLLIATAVYFAVVLLLGALATRRASRSAEEYFLAGRGLGTVVLFMALFGTNCTSFVLVGIPGSAFQHGIGVFGLNAAVVALGIPLTFWAIGAPARRMAKRLGALTPAELYTRRFGSRAVGVVLFAFFTLYTLPYMVQAVIGAGITVAQATGDAVGVEVAGLVVVLIALVYTSLGGMRATAWTNVFQGLLFLLFMVAAFFLMSRSLGGLGEAMARVEERDPGLLVRGEGWLFEPRKWASWGMVISLTVIGFPHMFARLLAADDDGSLRRVCRLYPLALALLWVPAVLIGVWGAGAFPDLGAADADRVFQRMASEHMPAWIGPFGFLAVLAAVMSTLDAQLLTLSSMLVRDALPAGLRGREVLAGRLFAVGLALVVYVLALVWERASVFAISRMAFEGYTTLVPTLLLGVRWRRFTAAGAIASPCAGFAVLALAWGGVALPTGGFLPVFWAVVAAFAAGLLVSLATPAQDEAGADAAFGASRPGSS
ncbi:MAG: sodium:solute symporter family protein [Planctomycetota bacterium]